MFGGFAQCIATWLIGVTGSKLAPAGYVVAVSVISMVAVFMRREMKGMALEYAPSRTRQTPSISHQSPVAHAPQRKRVIVPHRRRQQLGGQVLIAHRT
ncbi:Proline/betaine transporter [Pandoraea terrigena]|uniref:Proline/betaine transporter n=1 Tax=Pandoraea terrigena TaxID=2508292 RepID=A0A5E4Y298_9BURK|nr:Proline/betaine transporter [Pandoraea terrigena]